MFEKNKSKNKKKRWPDGNKKQTKQKNVTLRKKQKKQKKQQTSVNAMEGNQKTKNKFDHMEVFDKVLDTSYPQKVPL